MNADSNIKNALFFNILKYAWGLTLNPRINTVMMVDEAHVLLSGGNMKMKGMKERIHKEIKKLAPQNIKVRLHTPSNPENCAWIGANIISSLDKSKDMWIQKKEWFESDANVINIRTI